MRDKVCQDCFAPIDVTNFNREHEWEMLKTQMPYTCVYCKGLQTKDGVTGGRRKGHWQRKLITKLFHPKEKELYTIPKNEKIISGYMSEAGWRVLIEKTVWVEE